MPESTSEPRGFGGDSVPMRRIEEQALRERWPMRPEYRDAIVKRLTTIVADREPETPVDADPATRAAFASAKARLRRVAVGAARALIACEGQNQTDEHKRTPDFHQHEHAHAIKVYLPHNGRDEPLNVVDAPMPTIQPVSQTPPPAAPTKIRLPSNGRDA